MRGRGSSGVFRAPRQAESAAERCSRPRRSLSRESASRRLRSRSVALGASTTGTALPFEYPNQTPTASPATFPADELVVATAKGSTKPIELVGMDKIGSQQGRLEMLQSASLAEMGVTHVEDEIGSLR